jgi:hypothetical protein
MAYAHSLSHWGKPLPVPEWGGGILARPIPGGGMDGFGTYPIAILAPDADLKGGLERLRDLGLVAATLVLDDFHRPSLENLNIAFSQTTPFKSHAIRRLDAPFAYSKHHRYEVRRALASVSVGPLNLAYHIKDWMGLYGILSQRHGLGGVHNFPASHFEALAPLEGVTTIGAWLDDVLVSAHIWVSDGTDVHSHLAATSPAGYQVGASYAVYDASVSHFHGARLLNLGGSAGSGDDPLDGLARFKRGFANDTASAYICGAILDPDQYQHLTEACGVAADSYYFPAYRAQRV